MPGIQSNKPYTTRGDTGAAIVTPDLTQRDIDILRSCEPGSQRNRPEYKVLAQQFGPDGAQANYAITSATSPFALPTGLVTWPEFETGGYIDITLVGMWTNTVAPDVLTLNLMTQNELLQINTVQTVPLTYRILQAIVCPSIPSNASPRFVEIRVRLYCGGKQAQMWRGDITVATALTIIGGGDIVTPLDCRFTGGDHELRLDANVANANTTFTIRSCTIEQHCVRQEGAT